MKADLGDLNAFLAVAQARGFRDAARTSGVSASTLSEAVRRLETRLGVRLLHRTTRSVTPTEAGTRLIERLTPALGEVAAALELVNEFRDQPAGTLRLNVPVSAARLVLPAILPGFLAAYPGIRVEITAEDGFVDALGSGCDAGIRYEERLEQDMIAVPIGPRFQRFAVSLEAEPGGTDDLTLVDVHHRVDRRDRLLEECGRRRRHLGHRLHPDDDHPGVTHRAAYVIRHVPPGSEIFERTTGQDRILRQLAARPLECVALLGRTGSDLRRSASRWGLRSA